MVIAQHMPPVYTTYLAQRLDTLCPLSVREAVDGEVLEAGSVYIAPGDHHLTVERAPGGATLDEIVAATGWLSHTARGAMSGALKKKLGLTITSEKVDGRGRVYAIRD